MTAPRINGFGDRLALSVDARESQLVLGLDPDTTRLWPGAWETGAEQAPAQRGAAAVAEHCRLVIAATADQCVAVKLQVACFERLGAAGWRALEQTVASARDAGLLVIADAKRGDIDISAGAYGQAFFGSTETPAGPIGGLAADALTVNPLLGADSLVPLVSAARAAQGGLFVLVRTSNPGAADVQELELQGGGTVSDRLADIVEHLGRDGLGQAGLSDIGAVVGATAPQRMAALRERMPRTPFLLPGIGPQGGAIGALAAAFAPGRAGGLITVSRAIVEAHRQTGTDPAEAARRTAAQLRQQAWELASAGR